MGLRRATAVVTFLAAAALLFPPLVSGKTFRWKFEKGKTYNVHLKQTLVLERSVDGNTTRIPLDVSVHMTWTVKPNDDEGAYPLTQVIDRLTMKTKTPTQSIDYDSDSKEKLVGLAARIDLLLKNLIGAEIGLKMSDRGEILDVTIPEEAMKNLKSHPLGEQILSERQFSEMLKAGAPVLPQADIEPGHKWTVTFDTKMSDIGSMKLETQYTYAGEEDVDGRTLDRFDVNLNVQFTSDGDGEAKVTDQSGSGRLFFDSQAGQVVKSNQEQTMTLAATVAGRQLTQKMDQTMTVTITPGATIAPVAKEQP